MDIVDIDGVLAARSGLLAAVLVLAEPLLVLR
uniref:Uncharacterized protein n=1 Tax=Ralstonia solanacearum TaxID=305 RepID=A0A0S4TRQ1_RALSL|nr:protein of unknown function [Ralstonia solanacearum]